MRLTTESGEVVEVPDSVIMPYLSVTSRMKIGTGSGSGLFGSLSGYRSASGAPTNSFRNASETTWGGIRQRPGRGPETTSEGVHNGRFGERYTIDQYGRKHYI